MDTFQFSKKNHPERKRAYNSLGHQPQNTSALALRRARSQILQAVKTGFVPIDEILTFEFESLHESTDGVTCDPEQFSNPSFLTAREIAAKIDIPLYLLTHPGERKKNGVPNYRVGKTVRFKLDEILS